MLTAGFSQQVKRKLWCEVISTATKLDNIMVRRERTKPPLTLFYNDEPKYMVMLIQVRIACRVVSVLSNSGHLSVNASIGRDIRTRGMLEGVVATRTN